jgi:glycine oxidase
MKVDYIIVGQGIAGTCFAQQLLKNNKSFVVIDNSKKESASMVSAGLFNPVVLKRFTLIWRAKEELQQLKECYQYFESLLHKKYINYANVFRVFANQDEKELWKKKSLREDLFPYLKIEKEPINNSIKAPFGVGKVNKTGWISIKNLLEDFNNYLSKEGYLINEYFDYNELILGSDENQCVYKNIKSKKIVFCEGYAVKNNPYFNELPLLGNKGEVLLVKLNNPIFNEIYKGKVFVSPYEKDLNYLGATYNWEDKENSKTQEASGFLIDNFNKMYKQEYEVVDHLVGMRATVEDRRPLVGVHPKDKRLVVCNGLGTRGIMNGPLMAKELYDLLENKKEITPEVSITRFNTNFAL